MSWKCNDCGNDEEFEACATDYLRVVINANGDYIRKVVRTLFEKSQIGDLQISDEGIICHKCKGENVAWFEPKQVELDAVAN